MGRDVPAVYSGPGESLAKLRGAYSGKVAMLCNGASLPVDRLGEITCPTLGMNRTADLPFRSTFYLAMDPHWHEHISGKYPADVYLNAASYLPKRAPKDWGRGYRVPTSQRHVFSWDVHQDGANSTSTAAVGVQVLVYLGFTEIHALGLDLVGPHFDGTPAVPWTPAFNQQNEWFRAAARELEGKVSVYVCSSPWSRCDAFPRSDFEEVTK